MTVVSWYSSFDQIECQCSIFGIPKGNGLALKWYKTQIPKIHYNTLQYITIHYNTLQYITIHYNTLQYITIHYNTLQYITIHYNTFIPEAKFLPVSPWTNSCFN